MLITWNRSSPFGARSL